MTINILCQFLIVLLMIYAGAKIGGISMGIAGMFGTYMLIYWFDLKPGHAPIDVMLIIVAVICASAALQSSGGMDYLVGKASRFLKKHPEQITYLGPLVCWVFCLVAGTAHTSYAMLPIISEIAQKNKVRPERPLSVSVIAASLGITGSPVSAATAALISAELLGSKGVGMQDIMIICIPASLIAILVASFVQNHVGKELDADPDYQGRLQKGLVEEASTKDVLDEMPVEKRKKARLTVIVFLFGVINIIVLGLFPSIRPHSVTMAHSIEMVMFCTTGLIVFFGGAKIKEITKGSIFEAGMVAMINVFGVAWMGDTFFQGNIELFNNSISGIVSQAPILFAVALFIMSIMLFSQAATVKTLYPLGIALGINPLLLVAMFPACNGYFFLPNYPTEVAAINLDKTGTTSAGKHVIDHSFQLPGFITTIVSIGVACLIVWLFYKP